MAMHIGHVAVYETKKKTRLQSRARNFSCERACEEDAKKLCVNNIFYAQTKTQNKRKESNKK
jgi:hypothetical protein